MPSALVTGASSGIGLELARILAREHHNLVLVARGESRLVELGEELGGRYGVQCLPVTADLAAPGGAAELVRRIEDDGVELDVLINNAGFGLWGRFLDLDWGEQAKMLQINVMALTELTRLLVPAMVANHSGRILNVASTAAFQPGPLMAVYFATKAYVLSFGEALAVELAGTGVTVTTLAPGVTPTGFQARASGEISASPAGMSGGRSMIDRLRGLGVTSAVAVAEAGFQAMMEGKPLVVPGAMNKVGVVGIRVVPRRLVPRMVMRMQSHGL
jgi:short-subunit dehydrogenase